VVRRSLAWQRARRQRRVPPPAPRPTAVRVQRDSSPTPPAGARTACRTFRTPPATEESRRKLHSSLGSVSPRSRRPKSDCTRPLPAEGSLSGTNNQTITVAQQQYYLKVASCMRSHGVSNFPEPSFFGGSVEFQGLGHLPGIGIHSPLFTHAVDICRKPIPSALPCGSGSGG